MLFEELIGGLDTGTIILGLLFVIFFVFIQLILSRMLKDKNSASIIALCMSLLSIYGISKTGFDLTEFFYGVGINDNIIYTIIPIIILVGLIYLFWKVKLRFILTGAGIIMIVGSFFVYEKTTVLIIGIVALVLGLILMWREARRKVKKGYYLRS
jgi:hypothetical protein